MNAQVYSNIPTQEELQHSIKRIPIEYFEWGTYPDHFKMELPHRHSFSELLFFTQGGGIHEIEFKEYEIKQFSIHFIPASNIHFMQRGPQSDGFNIAFDNQYLEDNPVHKFIAPLGDDPFVLNLKKREFLRILEQCKVSKGNIQSHKGYYQQKCFLLSIELIINTIAAALDNGFRPDQHKQTALPFRKFHTLLQKSVQSQRRVDWYAQQLNLTSKHLSRIVKKQTGLSAKQYILKILLKSIKKELINTSKSIKEIAIDHHYDESALGKLFKKQLGCTMKSYRSYEEV